MYRDSSVDLIDMAIPNNNFSSFVSHMTRLSNGHTSKLDLISYIDNTWIIDSRNTDYITSNFSLITFLGSSSVNSV